jgi:hypothetical protein
MTLSVVKVRVIFSNQFSQVMLMVVRLICEICLSNVDDGGEGWGGILTMHKWVRQGCLVVVRVICDIRISNGGILVMHKGVRDDVWWW